MPSMIQSYVNMIQSRKEQNPNYAQDAWRTNVKTYAPAGKLIATDKIGLRSAVQADMKSLKYFANGVQGKGNDYSIGRINDVAIKLGGLGIAGMLAASSGSPLKKGMEFIGLACWLGAMSLWSKLAVHTPIKHFKGVDLNLEYENRKGRRKKFFQDPQFICWDLMSDKQINEMGDKLGVPRNIYNRRQAVQNKARQVAIQGNTLALATAGFATPLIAALAADKIGKHLYVPALERLQEINANSLREKMLESSNNLVHDQHTAKIINNSVNDIMSPEAKNSLKALFEKKTHDKSLQNVVSETVDKIFQNSNIKKEVIYLDDKVPEIIMQKLTGKVPSENELNLFRSLSRKFGNSLNKENFNEYMSQVGQTIKDNNLSADSRKINAALEDIAKTLKSNEVLQLTSAKTVKEQLINLSKLLDTYNVKIYQDLNKYLKYTLIGDSSTNANIWEQASNDIFKVFNLDKNTMKALANATSQEQSNKILGDVVGNIINNPSRFDETIKKLGKIALKLNLKNDKTLDFSLKYIDKMQTILNAYEKSGEFAAISEQLNKIIATQRQEILSKFMSTNNTIFAPIKVLSVLSDAKANKNIDYNVLKQLLFNSQTAETFINKLDNYKGVITNYDDYSKYANAIFGELSPKVKTLLPDKVFKSINENSKTMKMLLSALSDDVNFKFPMPSGKEVLENLKNSKFANYIDEYFSIGFNNKEAVADKIIAKAMSSSEKFDEIKGILKLSAQDIAAVKNGSKEPLKKALLGTKEIGAGYLENGRHRFKHLLQFLGAKNIDDLGEIWVKSSKVCKTSALEGKNFGAFIKDSAKKSFVYQAWFKKVGLSFLALCAITAFALSRIGKKNEFNPDIYKERGVA